MLFLTISKTTNFNIGRKLKLKLATLNHCNAKFQPYFKNNCHLYLPESKLHHNLIMKFTTFFILLHKLHYLYLYYFCFVLKLIKLIIYTFYEGWEIKQMLFHTVNKTTNFKLSEFNIVRGNYALCCNNI